MKYIMEFEDEPSFRANGANYYQCKDIRSFVANDKIIGNLTPLDKELEEAYQRGLNDAWAFASHLAYISDSVTDNIYISANGGKGLLVAFGMTYEEAKKTYDEYFDKKQKADDGIKVGDELMYTPGIMSDDTGFFVGDDTGFFVGYSTGGNYKILRYGYDGSIVSGVWVKEHCVKTGRHSDIVEQLIPELTDAQRYCRTCKYENDTIGVECRNCCNYSKWKPKGVTE